MHAVMSMAVIVRLACEVVMNLGRAQAYMQGNNEVGRVQACTLVKELIVFSHSALWFLIQVAPP